MKDLSEPAGRSVEARARQCHAGTRNIPFESMHPLRPIDARRPCCCTLETRWLLVPASLFIPLLASRQRPTGRCRLTGRSQPRRRPDRTRVCCVSVVSGRIRVRPWTTATGYCTDGSGPIDRSNNFQAVRTHQSVRQIETGHD